MKLKPSHPATSPTQIRAMLFDESVRVTDAQLLVVVLGMGTTRNGKGQVKKTWAAIELANDLMVEAGGRLEHLVATARRVDFDRRHFGLGKALGSRLLAAMEFAHRWRRGFKSGGDPNVRTDRDVDLGQKVLDREERLTEGELLVVLLSQYRSQQKEAASHMAAYPSLEFLVRSMTPEAFHREANNWRPLFRECRETVCRLLATFELARRHRQRARFERYTLKPGTFGLRSPYLIKLLDPESPIDRPTRQRLLANVRSNPRMATDFAQLDRLAADAVVDDHEQAIKLHVMFEALYKNRKWAHPAEVLGESVPYRALLSIAEARIARTKPGTRSARVKELLTAAELAATQKPLAAFVATLAELGVSESGVERAFEEARRRLGEAEAPRG